MSDRPPPSDSPTSPDLSANSTHLPSPTLQNTNIPSTQDHRFLMAVIVIPYVFLCAVLLGFVVVTSVEEARITLAASAILAPLGTLAGGIVSYYFRASS